MSPLRSRRAATASNVVVTGSEGLRVEFGTVGVRPNSLDNGDSKCLLSDPLHYLRPNGGSRGWGSGRRCGGEGSWQSWLGERSSPWWSGEGRLSESWARGSS